MTTTTHNNNQAEQTITTPPPTKPYLTSSSQSSVMMHTYANPFQNSCGGGGGSSFSEDTTGPIIPEMNTLRPSQLLKSSFAGSGPPPNLHAPPSANRNMISCFANRLWSHVSNVEPKADLTEHRCSWRASTITLIVLVFVLLLIIIILCAMSSTVIDPKTRPQSSKVPCLLVEDFDPTSSFHLSASSSVPSLPSTSPSNRAEYILPHISPENQSPASFVFSSLPRDILQFKEIHLSDSNLNPFSFRLDPYTTWTVWFTKMESSSVIFQFYAPPNARLVMLANKNEPPSLSVHHIFQVISDEALATSRVQRRMIVRRSDPMQKLLPLQTIHHFDQGSWYLTIVNDLEQTLPIVLNVSVMHNNVSAHCPNNCHNRGNCHLGKCRCFPGYIGHNCADNVCPIFCGGHGQYLQGSCRCKAGWKGRECTIRIEECEVPNCNGNGRCIEGICQCRNGFKGEHCEQVDCLDPQCSNRGICFEGVCMCKTGWSGLNCSQPDSKLHRFFPNCSNNGVFNFETGQCVCGSQYSGKDCSKSSCTLECGSHGHCQDGRCLCADSWFGEYCDQRQCDSRCREHGKCVNGTCVCDAGWMGKFCTLNGCPNSCTKHGQCESSVRGKWPDVSKGENLGNGPQWFCRCDEGWGGHDCSAPQETNCNDEIDNDNDGLVDCADSECCRHEQCGHQSLMCITSPDPLDILLRKQPPSPISSFFQKVHFLIEDGSVQSYAQKDAYSEKRASVIRGQVVSKEFNGLIGVRVSVATDPQFGFTLTRSDGWFDILVNGGGIVTLQFQRNPFYPIKKSIYVSWNDFGVIQSPIVMFSVPDGNVGSGNFHTENFIRSSSSFAFSQFSLLPFDLSQVRWTISQKHNTSLMNDLNCAKLESENVIPRIRYPLADGGRNIRLTGNTGANMCGDESCILAEEQTLQEKIPIDGTRLHLVYQSSLAQGYFSKLHIELTPAHQLPKTLRFVLVRILIEGNIHERIFEAEPNLVHKFLWNKRNVYKQKVYGIATAKVYVGYIYHDCAQPVWNALHARLRGFDMEISELGAWNLDIHHRYNRYDSLFQRGDGQMVHFRDSNDPLLLLLEPIAGHYQKPRPYVCGANECNIGLANARFYSLLALTTMPDGSILVGDGNLIRRITTDGQIQTIHQFKSHSNRPNYEYYIAFNSVDGFLYISNSEKFQIIRVQISDKSDFAHQMDTSLNLETEIVVGTGKRCLPHDRNLCGDGKLGVEARLIYPKGMAFGVDGTLFFADGNMIRSLDSNGIVHRIIGDWAKTQWKPIFCQQSRPSNEVKLHWPINLAVNSVDGSLYFVDNNVVFKLNHQMHISIVAGLPSYCLEDTLTDGKSNWMNDSKNNCQSQRLDSKFFSYCGEDILFGSIAFSPNGELYISDISRQSENRIFSLNPDGSLIHIAGAKSAVGKTEQEFRNCSVERCLDISGINCTCLITDTLSLNNENAADLANRTIGIKGKLFSITALATTGDGTLYIADEGSLRLLKLQAFTPQVDDQLEIKILSPNLGEMYTFNQHGQHMSTRSTITGRTLFTFHYNQDNNFGKLSDVVDVAGNKLSFIRDSTGALHTVESSFGSKSFVTVNKLGLLEQFGNGPNDSFSFDYFPNALIRSKTNTMTGRTLFYFYDQDGRVDAYLMPEGNFVDLIRRFVDNESANMSEEILLLRQTALFDDVSNSKPSLSDQFELIFSSNGIHQPSQLMKLRQLNRLFEMRITADGSIQANISRIANLYITGKASQLSHVMLPMQSHVFPLMSHYRIERVIAGQREPINAKSLELNIEFNLKMRSSMISAVEKFVAVNNSLVTKLEYDWKANREIYYNQSQRPILYVQFDENGRPIQWQPNSDHDMQLPHTFEFDKAGNLISWRNGSFARSYVRDRVGRFIEARQSDHSIRYSYALGNAAAENQAYSQLPTSAYMRSGHKYTFELDSGGRIRAIITPKNSRHEFHFKIILGYNRFAYCPPNVLQSEMQENLRYSLSRCFSIYFDDQHRPMMKTLPYNGGKIVYRYGSRISLSKDIGKELNRYTQNSPLIEQIIFGNGLVERWYDRKGENEARGIWRSGNMEFGIVYKHYRSNGLPKHMSYQFINIHSISQLTYNYRYDAHLRLRTIQSKLSSIDLPALEFEYDSKGKVDSIDDFRFFERTPNETLLGDGVALFVHRYDPSSGKMQHSSLTIAEKEVIRIDYIYDSLRLLIQTRTFMRHLGANKMRVQNFTYDADSQLIEVQGREHWRFVYDFNGNLVTFLYLGNRIDIDYDAADRVRNFGKGHDGGSSHGGSSPYVTDARGFVVKRGEEHLTYNQLGQLLSAVHPQKRYDVHYLYDHVGRLVLRRDQQNNVTQYFYGNPRRPNLLTHALNNADGKVLSFIYDDRDSLLMVRVNNENFYVACDQVRSPLLVLDHRGQVIKELHRSPFGHLLFDSNPAFYLPVDFHGGIADSLTNLVHFPDSRVYDTLTGRWLTPNIDSLLFKFNLVKNPRLLHLYQFQANDPINMAVNHAQNNIISASDSNQILLADTDRLIQNNIDIEQLRLLSQLHLPSDNLLVRSGLFSSLRFVIEKLKHFSSFETNYFSKLTPRDWTAAKSMWNLISTTSAWPDYSGIVFARRGARVQVFTHSRAVNLPFLQFCVMIINGSNLLDVHLTIDGIDHFYLLREKLLDNPSMVQLKKLQPLLNLTINNSDSSDRQSIIDVVISRPTIVVNIRLGSTIDKERERILRLAKIYAVEQRIALERKNIQQELTHTWIDEERQFLLSTHEHSWQLLNGPFKVDYYHSSSTCSQLADDASNILLKPKKILKQLLTI